jgi:PKD repeat protein
MRYFCSLSNAPRLFFGVVFMLFVSWSFQSSAQVQLNFCFQAGQPFGPNDNLFVAAGVPFDPTAQVFFGPLECLTILPNGDFAWITEHPEDCCGIPLMTDFFIGGGSSGNGVGGLLIVEIKCPKPDCNLIDLNPYLGGSDGSAGGNPGNDLGCVHVCAESEVTFFVDWNPAFTYSWNVIAGGTGNVGSNPADYIVNWGPVGTGFISLTITDQAGNVNTILVCVDILPKPIASFTSSGYACLGQPLCFTNTSFPVGVSSFWDFGDGNVSEDYHPCHTYTSPGTYTVTLTVTNENQDAQGNPLCCCTDVYTMEVVIDELPGPNIFCISTLCQGDEDCYSTDATNCTTYTWTVLDANGNPAPYTVTGPGTICVTWPIGPFGTITLAVTGCDSTYCDNPTTVVVPVISNVSDVFGPVVVCANSTETYSVPKWMSAAYSWTVTGGTINGTGTGHIENITWGGPGTGTITVNYNSPFLGQLPGQDPLDCSGIAELDVLILPKFSLEHFGPSAVCLGSFTSIDATANPYALPDPNFQWTVTPPHPFSGQGTPNFSAVWTTPGTYIITAENLSGLYCNESQTKVIIVYDVPPALGIDGPISVCAGDTHFYSVLPNGSGYSYLWSVLGGIPTGTTGNTIGVMWNPGGGTITVQQVMTTAPFCPSQPFSLTVLEKGPHGPYSPVTGPACLNNTNTYSFNPVPHPDASVSWSLSMPGVGSILGNPSINSVDIQWGTTLGPVTIMADIELCGNVISVPIPVNLVAPIVPSIVQSGDLCPGGNETLTAIGGPFTSFNWSLGSTSSTQTITASGTVSLTTMDANGCEATVFHTVIDLPAPVTSIHSPDPTSICPDNPFNVNMFAQTNANYDITWRCSFNGGPPTVVQGPSPVANYTHVYQGVYGTYAYSLVVVDNSTGCTTTWGSFVVYEYEECDGDPGDICIPEDHFLLAIPSQNGPYCNEFNFSYSASPNFTFSGWTFGDGGSSVLPNPMHTYNSIGFFTAGVCGLVPHISIPDSLCLVCRNVPITVTLVADFDISTSSCGIFDFLDLSTYLDGPGNQIVAWAWTSSDGHTSSSSGPVSFTFLTNGPKWVELEVTNANGCKARITKNFNFNGLSAPVITGSGGCQDDPLTFSASAPGAVSFDWTMGDGGTLSGQSVIWAYNNFGSFPVTVTATDAVGCTSTSNTVIIISPKPAGAVITGPSAICQGDLAALTVNVDPSNGDVPYTYLWSPSGLTSQTVNVGQGSHSVTIFNIWNCPITVGPFEVVEVQLPNATISGPAYICDAGCVTLSVPFDPGNTYQWLDDNGNPIPFQTSHQLWVCDWDLLPSYSVQVTGPGPLFCTSIGGPFTVQLAVSPTFTVDVNPTPACAGSPTVLTVNPIDPGVSYVWSTGATGPSITVFQAGTYFVLGTDMTSGCSSSASAVINPLPDLCIVPVGCYEVCEDTQICGPDGLAFYQWNLNGVPFSYSQCITVTTSGVYSLTATNSFGCTTTSGDLELTVIPCPDDDCDLLSVVGQPAVNDEGELDPCCITLSYTNDFGPLKGLNIFTNNGNLTYSNIHTALDYGGNTSNSLYLTGPPIGNPIPSGTLPNFVTVCVTNPTSSPQWIYIEWINQENQVICLDSLSISCPVEPPCIYMSEGDIWCEGQETFLTMTICNPNSNSYPIGYVDISVSAPASVTLVPGSIDLTGSPILPGNCAAVTIQLTGLSPTDTLLCFNLIGHEFNPNEFPGSLCCSLDTLYCLTIPICDPCPLVSIEGWVPASSGDDDGCCFDIYLTNNFAPNYFDQIGLNVLSPATTFGIANFPGSGWTTSGYNGISALLNPDPLVSGVPVGTFSLPTICIQTNTAPWQSVEITWIKDGEVICRDTLQVFCEPPCGYVAQESIECNTQTGEWMYTMTIKNTSSVTVSSAYVEFLTPGGLSFLNQMVTLGAVPPGGFSGPISFTIGSPAQAGDIVCIKVTLHEWDDNELFLFCCDFEHCFELPECEQVEPVCECGPIFTEAVASGFSHSQVSGLTYQFTMNNPELFGPCDQFRWIWGYNTPQTIVNGIPTATHTFPSPGTYQVCVRVIRTLPDGTVCNSIYCTTVLISAAGMMPEPEPMTLYPNPSSGQFKLKMFEDAAYPVSFTLYDLAGRAVAGFEQKAKPEENTISFDSGALDPGIYLLHFRLGADEFTRKVVIQ